MTGSYVVDASIAIGWVHPSQATVLAASLLNEIEAGAQFIVPPLWFMEVANALIVLERRKRLTRNERQAAISRIHLLSPIVGQVQEKRVFGQITSFAYEHGLSVYDAVYLDLAKRSAVPLATQDIALKRAARASGVAVVESEL